MFHVYKILNKLNGKIYIGVHKSDDPYDDYMGSGPLIKKAISKYGLSNFEKSIIESFDDAESAYLLESKIVDEEFISRDDTYNLTIGGIGGWHYVNSLDLPNPMTNPASVKKVSDSIKARIAKDPEKYRQISIKNWAVASRNKIGTKQSEETKSKIAAGLAKFYASNDSKILGVPKSESTKELMREAWTEEKREEKSKWMKDRIAENPDVVKTNLGKKFSESTKSKMSDSAKKRSLERAKDIAECPHCGKTGVRVNMKRWHFENCRSIK